MTRKLRQNVAKILLVLVGVVSLTVATGCDEWMYPGDFYPGNYLGNYGYTYPDFGLYNPTHDIQSVIDYRLNAMEASNNGWDEYIRQYSTTAPRRRPTRQRSAAGGIFRRGRIGEHRPRRPHDEPPSGGSRGMAEFNLHPARVLRLQRRDRLLPLAEGWRFVGPTVAQALVFS